MTHDPQMVGPCPRCGEHPGHATGCEFPLPEHDPQMVEGSANSIRMEAMHRITIAAKRLLLCPLGYHAPSLGRSMGTSIERKRRGNLRFFAYSHTCPRCHLTYRRWA